MQYLVKLFVSAVIIVLISEMGKRNTVWASLIASLPFTSILAMIWLYRETEDVERVASLANGIFWLVLPSLVFFWMLPFLLHKSWGFWSSLFSAGTVTILIYFFTIKIINA